MDNENRIDLDDWYDNYNYLRQYILIHKRVLTQDSFKYGAKLVFDCLGDKKHSKTVGKTTKQ